ncbi:protein-export membrane protein SecF [Desulfurobacterium thermolithotrophum DSM 11699]|uniref:Protein-export membrane protein SecF n=1 Tax=Desulfurobacterium thermolithotrophum (strain DSM 11699 / BSA) TaxID=868864 RepID=F0S041_DESTD|nr:protein translocase subunit SecF [Desulfurobacterium thermolithotrophum]ADY73722.1 protein-export membrane protein SecF [Desulfurobacterium thermolithotrophum DSM 11699]
MERKFDFIGKRYIAYFLSFLLIAGSWFYGAFIKGAKFGIDFTGGALVQVKIEDKNVNTETLRQLFKGKVEGVTVQNIETANEFLIKAPVKGDPNKTVESVTKTIKEKFNGKAEIRRVEMIGPTVGKELREKGIMALIYAMIGILLYVAWRFEAIFAFGAVLALFHDTLATTGIFMAVGREFSLPVIAALLTVIGYSINDTIVVYDRIRENMKVLLRSKPFEEIVNESINQTLSRTIITSLTTFFVVLCLYIFGGGVINDFAFVLLVGIIVGTYSSIFIASAIVVDWYKRVKKVK